MSFVEVLRQATTRLEKSEIQYMITGSIAASYYGLIRATEDLDIVISADPAKLRTFMGLFPSDEYYAPLQDALEAHQHQSMFNVLDMVRSWKIDLIFEKHTPFHREAFRRRRSATFEGVLCSRSRRLTPKAKLLPQRAQGRKGANPKTLAADTR
jgi:hypothetical protein